jgi:hypothetical protein
MPRKSAKRSKVDRVRTSLRVLLLLATAATLGWVATPASAAPNPLEETLSTVRGVVDTTLQSLPQPEPPATSPLTDVLPPVSAPPRTVEPQPPASGDSTAPEGSGTPTAPPAEEDVGAPVASPTGTHLPATIALARDRSSAEGRQAAEHQVGGPPPIPERATSFAIPEPAPPTATAALDSAAPSASGGGDRAQPVALSDWIGSGPPLPALFVYLAVFASGLAIFVSMRRELGLHPRRRRRF